MNYIHALLPSFFSRPGVVLQPDSVSHVSLSGDINPLKLIYTSKSAILPPPHMYWRPLGAGHFLQVTPISVDLHDFSSCM